MRPSKLASLSELYGDPRTAKGKAMVTPGKRKPGRPLGAINKRTERTVTYLLSRHKDPREVLLEIAESNVYDLAALFQCTLLEAAQEKRLCAIAALPYVAARITPEIADNRQLINLTINGAGSDYVGYGPASMAQLLEADTSSAQQDTQAIDNKGDE